MKVTVSRLDSYPADEPTGWAVGFLCECGVDASKSFYVDTVVSFGDAVDDEDAVNKALDVLGTSINDRCAAISAKSSLLGADVSDRVSEVVVDSE